jgi:hypothetical protein
VVQGPLAVMRRERPPLPPATPPSFCLGEPRLLEVGPHPDSAAPSSAALTPDFDMAAHGSGASSRANSSLKPREELAHDEAQPERQKENAKA